MPELPEVEAIRTQLDSFLTGHTIKEVEVKNRKIFAGDEKVLVGAKVTGARRFGKVISVDLDNGYSFLTHVKLTGQYIYRGPNLETHQLSKKVVGGVPGPHTHVTFNLDKNGFLYYNDIRRFGWIRVMKTSSVEEDAFVKKLGPEPFGKKQGKPEVLTLDHFQKILSATRRPIKVVIMDQAKMGGIGNIYANDALWDSQIDPKRPANSLESNESERLFNSIEKVLKEGIKYGGASELAFVTPDGGEGGYQKHFLAYAQDGNPCPRCHKEKFKKYMLGGRGTYVCSYCQK